MYRAVPVVSHARGAMPMKTALLRAVLLGALMTAAAACSGAGGGSVDPEDVPGKIRDAAQIVRKDWQRDAMLVSVLIERADAKDAFAYRYVFSSSGSPKYMQLTRSAARTGMAEAGVRANVEVVPGTQVMDLPRAVSIARGAGMKGHLLTAELKQWTSDALENVSVPVVIWRLVPDDDPNVADPNDPNMKNYLVDALLGTVYDADRPEAEQLIRGSNAFSKAMTAEMAELMGSMRPR